MLTWHKTERDQRIYLETEDEHGHRLSLCAPVPDHTQTHYLMPVRMLEPSTSAERSRDALFDRGIEAHTQGLQEKIRAIDRLKLSEVRFAERFAASRMMIKAAAENAEQQVWRFARQAMDELPGYLPLPVVSQIDYDQKRMHASLGGILESVDFAVRHDPSAIATTIAFERMLQYAGIPIEQAIISVTGVGDLGSRLVRRFLQAGVRTVYVCDQNRSRLEQVAALPDVKITRIAALPDTGCHAHVLSADKSFNDDIAKMWASAESVAVVGGPEAGIDRFAEARQLLAAAGKEYVPSVLCGSLGLVSNLEESLGIAPNLEHMSWRYQEMLNQIVTMMCSTDSTLSLVCEQVLSGEIALGATVSP